MSFWLVADMFPVIPAAAVFLLSKFDTCGSLEKQLLKAEEESEHHSS